MSKPRFKAAFQGPGESSLRLEITSYNRGARVEVKHYLGALPVANCFTGDADLLDDIIEGFVRARDILRDGGK